MAGRINDEDIQSLKERLNIVDVIQPYTALKRSGSSHMGRCPFHDEKSASFSVQESKGFYHCLAGETEVITWEGVRSIKELAGTTHRVMTTGGVWVDAPFRSYGEQRLWAVNLSRNRVRKTIYATDEHRWLVRGQGRASHREVLTKALKRGHRLAHAFGLSPVTALGPPSEVGVAAGFAFGEVPWRRVSDIDENAMLEAHRARFEAIPVDRLGRERRGWVVESVGVTDRIEEVYCAEVAGTHAFALADNILTGNCFGCGVGGDAIRFVQEMEGLGFNEAVEKLARQVGMTLRYAEMRPGQHRALGRRTQLLELLAAADDFYRARLRAPAGEPARRYLQDRQVDVGAWETFGLGWAPDTWSELSDHLAAKGAKAADMVEAGLSTQGKRGMLDRFRARVLFPIRDARGTDVVAFGGRILPGGPVVTKIEGTAPKYINSPKTDVYDKSTTLYGLDLARREIVKRKEVLVVEGYMDVIALHLAGMGNAVAPCGTALTEQHFAIIQRMEARVTLALDADAAGFEAAERARERAASAGVADLGVLVLPEGQDPADLVAAGGAAAVEEALARRKTALEFQIEHLLRGADTSTPEAKTAAYRSTFDLLGKLADPALRYHYVFNVVAPAVGLPAQRIEDELSRAHPLGRQQQSRSGLAPARREAMAPPGSREVQMQLERQVLQVALQEPELLPEDWLLLDEEVFTAEPSRVLYRALSRHGADFTAVLEAMPDDDMRSRVRGLAAAELTVARERAHVARLVDALRGRHAKKGWEAARTLLREGGERLDATRLRDLMREIGELERVWRAYERRDMGPWMVA